MNVSVIIPALNEELAIEKVVRGALEYGANRVVVVDNGSIDSTAHLASSAGAEIVHENERGYGAACLAGMAHLKPLISDHDIIMFMDGDAADDPSQIPDLIRPISSGQADMVIGSRSQGDSERGSITPHQRFGNWLASQLLGLLYAQKASDLGPFRAIRASTLYSLGMQDRNYGWTVEMQVKAAKQGLKVVEIPVKYRRRIGESKVSGTLKGSLMAGYKILFTLFRYA